MEVDKQRLVLSCLANSRELMAMCSGILKPSYFDPSLKKSVRFMQDYFTSYKDVPRLSTIRAESGLVLEEVPNITRADIEYVSKEVETFCQNRAAMEAILAGPELIAKGEFNKVIESMKTAIAVGLDKDIGVDYFADPETRLHHTLETMKRISTGMPDFDVMLGGGLQRQELIVFAANSGGGKSMNMLSLAKNLLAQGYHGVYISLEMSQDVVTKRMDSMITKIGQDNLLKEMQRAVSLIRKAGVSMGRFIVKRMPENRTNINTIRAYLQQLEQKMGFRPDFIVVDYLDIMGTTANISLDNLFVKDKFVTEEVRSLGYDFDAIMISASQLGRSAIEADKLNQAHIQGGISKINTSDYTIGIKQDDLMRASGEIYYEILKARNSSHVGERLLLGWDPISLVTHSLQQKKEGLNLVKKQKVVLGSQGTVFEQPRPDGVLGLMNT